MDVAGQVFGMCRGSFAEYVCAPELAVGMSALARKPGNIAFEQAAATPVAAFTALQGLRDKGKIQPSQKVLINGAARRSGYARRANGQVLRRGRDRLLQRQECGSGSIPRRGSGHMRWEPCIIRVQTRLKSQGDIGRRRRTQWPLDRSGGPSEAIRYWEQGHAHGKVVITVE